MLGGLVKKLELKTLKKLTICTHFRRYYRCVYECVNQQVVAIQKCFLHEYVLPPSLGYTHSHVSRHRAACLYLPSQRALSYAIVIGRFDISTLYICMYACRFILLMGILNKIILNVWLQGIVNFSRFCDLWALRDRLLRYARVLIATVSRIKIRFLAEQLNWIV